MKKFKSGLAPLIYDYITHRKASNRWSETSSYNTNIISFDIHCSKNYPNTTNLTQEMVDTWCSKRDKETEQSRRTRIFVIKSFIDYLRKRGQTAILMPEIPPQEANTHIPHSFTERELQNFFNECDNIKNSGKTRKKRAIKISVPVFFRLLYSSGMRPFEARMLDVGDVDLQTGVINIKKSKGGHQHYVVVDDSMLKVMKGYDKSINMIYPNRTFFFPSNEQNHYTESWVSSNFRRAWDKHNNTYAIPYDFRHNYAIENINSWINEGLDFFSKLVYLSKSMGHATLESTKYYYSLVPALSTILKDKTNEEFEKIVPEVKEDEKSY